jgi:hypothetical protein
MQGFDICMFAFIVGVWIVSSENLRSDEHAMPNSQDPTEIHPTVEPFIALTWKLHGIRYKPLTPNHWI